MAENLADTCKPEPVLGDPIFACHHSREGDESPCISWAAVHGHANLSMRLGANAGRFDPVIMGEVPVDWDLHESYDEMMDKLRAQFQEIDDE